ncbi:hypothetical protein BDA99DRAFT_532320 [Phascolomyces articulosus]|uniref:Uncharacterized protein n=1 Tax=Phascolomyces articulosus TaxID=60185 RepID=A0AAD5PK64_9FUNG|nr:hypothetical protein BDA99DRAFT_532320 [Phascolomyces articulosus]
MNSSSNPACGSTCWNASMLTYSLKFKENAIFTNKNNQVIPILIIFESFTNMIYMEMNAYSTLKKTLKGFQIRSCFVLKVRFLQSYRNKVELDIHVTSALIKLALRFLGGVTPDPTLENTTFAHWYIASLLGPGFESEPMFHDICTNINHGIIAEESKAPSVNSQRE